MGTFRKLFRFNTRKERFQFADYIIIEYMLDSVCTQIHCAGGYISVSNKIGLPQTMFAHDFSSRLRSMDRELNSIINGEFIGGFKAGDCSL